MRKNNYSTVGKELVLKCFKEHMNEDIKIEDVIKYLEGENVGKSSVYRIIEKFVAEGLVVKNKDEKSASSVYRFIGDCKNHGHLKCTSCGKVIHLHCRVMNDLMAHIEDAHGFSADSARTTIYGICSDCRRVAAE